MQGLPDRLPVATQGHGDDTDQSVVRTETEGLEAVPECLVGLEQHRERQDFPVHVGEIELPGQELQVSLEAGAA